MRWIIKTTILILAFTGYPYAQWEYGGRQIGIGQPEVYPCLAPDGAGGVFVVWQGCTGELDSSYIMLNHFDTSGAALFGEEGIAIARCPLSNTGEPQIASDGLGGCFVVWTQGPTDNWGPMYLQRIGYNGELLWPENKQLIYRSGDAYPFRGGLQLLADTSFGAIAVCLFDTGYGGWEILGQRSDYEGNILWDSAGIHVLDFIYNPQRWSPKMPKLCKSGNNFYCTWIDGRNLQGDIYAQRFDISGNIYFGPGGVPVCTTGGSGDGFERQSMQIVPDGSGGVVVGWKYSGFPGETRKAQRISSQGNPYWQINGIQLLPIGNYGRGLGLYQIGPRFMAISIDHTEGHYEIFDNNGNMEYGGQGRDFGPNLIYAASFQNNILYFLKRIPNQWYYYGSKGDTLNYEYWPNLPFVHEGVDHGYQVLPDGFGGLYAVLSDYRDWNTDWVILQRIYPDGYIGGDTLVEVTGEVAFPLPDEIALFQNYPNPFNSSTMISFRLIESAKITMHIANILGQTMAAYNLGWLKGGDYSQRLDFSDCPAGVYFVRLQAGEYRETKKMLLLK